MCGLWIHCDYKWTVNILLKHVNGTICFTETKKQRCLLNLHYINSQWLKMYNAGVIQFWGWPFRQFWQGLRATYLWKCVQLLCMLLLFTLSVHIVSYKNIHIGFCDIFGKCGSIFFHSFRLEGHSKLGPWWIWGAILFPSAELLQVTFNSEKTVNTR